MEKNNKVFTVYVIVFQVPVEITQSKVKNFVKHFIDTSVHLDMSDVSINNEISFEI